MDLNEPLHRKGRHAYVQQVQLKSQQASALNAGSLLDFSYGVLEELRGDEKLAGEYYEKSYAADPTAMPLVRIIADKRLDEGDRAKHVSAAKNKIARGARFVGQNAVQIHGGIGISNELAVGHYFKRSTMIEGQFGSVDYHLGRYERISMG